MMTIQPHIWLDFSSAVQWYSLQNLNAMLSYLTLCYWGCNTLFRIIAKFPIMFQSSAPIPYKLVFSKMPQYFNYHFMLILNICWCQEQYRFFTLDGVISLSAPIDPTDYPVNFHDYTGGNYWLSSVSISYNVNLLHSEKYFQKMSSNEFRSYMIL